LKFEVQFFKSINLKYVKYERKHFWIMSQGFPRATYLLQNESLRRTDGER